MSYIKPWTAPADQLATLVARGLIVTDNAKALACLDRIGYYRLSGYWYPFRLRDPASNLVTDQFKPNATLQNAVDLYVFDKQLRLLAMDALERIEISLRVDISHLLGELDTFAYLKSDLFHKTFGADLDRQTGLTKHHTWLTKHAQLIGRSKEEFVNHNKTKYGLPLAVWVACEVWDFGTLSTLFGGMRQADQDAIAVKYGVANGRTFASWLRSLNYLRNVCAHHSRLWNRNIVDQPKLPPAADVAWVAPFETSPHARARCYLLICMLRHMLVVINPTSHWPGRMKTHLLAFPDLARLGLDSWGFGAATGWEADW